MDKKTTSGDCFISSKMPRPVERHQAFWPGVAYGEGFCGQDFRSRVGELGCHAYKIDLYWNHLMDAKGELTLNRFRSLVGQIRPGDRCIVQLYTDHYIACVDRKSWPRGGPVKPEFLGFFDKLMMALREAAAGRVWGWQLNTEPATPGHWPSENAVGYVELTNRFGNMIDQVTGKVILGAWAPGEPWDGKINLAFWQCVFDNALYDYAAVHLYGRVFDIPAKIHIMQQTCHKESKTLPPILVTECGGPDLESEFSLSEDMNERLAAIKAAGVEVALWWSLQEDFRKTDAGSLRFQPFALMDSSNPDSWIKRPAFDLYRKAVAKVTGPEKR